ncbi:MAG: hypothetical protein ACTTI3_08195 [Treponema sp.]
MKVNVRKLSYNMEEIQKYIIEYRSILEKDPDDFSAQLTLASLEQHKKDLEYQLEAEKEEYRKEQCLNDLLVPAHLPAVHKRIFPQSGSHVEA